MEGKSFLTSKTLWVNILALVVLLVQTQTGFIIDGEVQAAILLIINLILRLITKQPIEWKTNQNTPVAYLLLAGMLLMGSAAMQGCATTQEGQPVQVNVQSEAVQDLAVKIAARQLGYAVGKNNPARIDGMTDLCNKFSQEGADVPGLFVSLLDSLDVEVAAYPLLKPDLQDLLEALDIKILDTSVILTERQAHLIGLAVSRFSEGVGFAKAEIK